MEMTLQRIKRKIEEIFEDLVLETGWCEGAS